MPIVWLACRTADEPIARNEANRSGPMDQSGSLVLRGGWNQATGACRIATGWWILADS
jgi:hypothetical protein